jgi:tetratricopeptide (TPR) repeat protein
MLPPRFFLFFLSSLLLSSSTFTNGQPDDQSKLRHLILAIQEQLLPTNEMPKNRRTVLENRLEQLLRTLVKEIHKSWRNTPRPAERLDNQEAELTPGQTPLWYLMEIPQWWVTATLVRVNDDNSLVVLVTSTGQEETVTRGDQVRVVRDEDQVAWDSEYRRDQGEWARVRHEDELRKQKYEEALQVDPTNPHALDNLGLYYGEHGDLEQSKYWLQKSIEANPNWYHAYYNLGLLYRDHSQDDGDRKKALELIETAFQLNPLFLDSLWNVADLYGKLGNQPEACYHWRLLRALNRNPSPGYRNVGRWNEVWEEYTTILIQECMGGDPPKQPQRPPPPPKPKDDLPDFMKFEL